MVRAAALVPPLEQECKSGISNVDFKTNNGQYVSSALPLSNLESVRRSTREAIKRKLTARVLPMTRVSGEIGENTSTQFQNGEQSASQIIHHISRSRCAEPCLQPSADRNCNSSPFKEEQQESTAGVNSRTKDLVASGKTSFRENHLYQPPTKRQRTILPRTIQLTELQPVQREPLSPEPKLMSDNVATMSLLSASECHLATLQDEDGDTPLHIAIAHENKELSEYLIDLVSCLTVDTYNNLKQTPLHLAVITEQPLIVRKLVTSGANVNLPDRNGQTPAHLACQRSNTECLEELFHKGNKVDSEIRNFNGFTPLHEGVFTCSVETIQCLATHGANINCKDGKSGRTPLHHAVEIQNIALIEQLLKCGADPSVPSFSGNTPLQTASGRGSQHIKMLLETSTNSFTIKPGMAQFKENYETFSECNQAVTVFNSSYKKRRRAVMIKDTYI